MSLASTILSHWQHPTVRVVEGWLPRPGSTATYGEADAGRHYVTVSCADLALQFDQTRFTDRRPVLQSLITWPTSPDPIEIPRTVGPSNFASLVPGQFNQLITKRVMLTPDLPMNAGALDILVALLSVPGESLLDVAAGVLSSLSSLVQVPQLTAAAPIAAKIAEGADALLGNDRMVPLLGVHMSMSAHELQDGYYVATTCPVDAGRLDDLSVDSTGQLLQRVGDTWQQPSGFDYLVLDVHVLPSDPEHWETIDSLQSLVTDALEDLAGAKSEADVFIAGAKMRMAIARIHQDPHLTVLDHANCAVTAHARWLEDVNRWRDAYHEMQAGTPAEPGRQGFAPAPAPPPDSTGAGLSGGAPAPAGGPQVVPTAAAAAALDGVTADLGALLTSFREKATQLPGGA